MTEAVPGVSIDELRLAARNHGMPLEALQYDVTPVGLHYLLTHYDIPVIDGASWRLTVTGSVRNQLELSLDELRAMPSVTRRVTMECAGNGRAFLEPRPVSQPWLLEAVGTGEWTGPRLADLLARADLEPSAVEIVFTGVDRGLEQGVELVYERSLSVAIATTADVLLAYELNGAPLPPQHGFPLRVIVPGWYGMASVKWLGSIRAVDSPFAGFQQATSYRLRQHEDEPGEAVTRIQPRSLMIPPGIPDFLTRTRHLDAGDHRLTGRAWSGLAPITEVAVSTDEGATWQHAEVEPAGGEGVWQAWARTWRARSGQYELWCRAADAAGNIQPLTPPWNLGGYVNNAVQRIPVVVS
jgi:DMSO/TMAO reductase YedYZ molybdopterin-dependent catalytic subunit